MSEYTPITGELRERIRQAEHIVPLSGDSKDTQVRINLAWLKEKLDAIDSIHAQLERENASLKAELGRVLGEQEDRRSCIYYDPERHYCSCHDIDTDGLVELPVDVEHQKALDEWKAKHGQMWLKGYSECHAELLEGNETLASDLERCGWIRLPKDADGEYIRVGDVLDGYGKTIEVVEMRHGRSGWVLISRDGNGYADTFAFSHRQPDSWERIIEDAWNGKDSGKNLVARCKALAGDAE